VPDFSLSPGRFAGNRDGTNAYFYDFGPVASATQTFTVTNNGPSIRLRGNDLTLWGGD
jgi:hypothetical protein